MAAFLAVFLFILELVSCQRKVSRNVAVGADVKTVVNFNCPEEFGYYPHPNDCTQYYVCVFGGALLESCTGGLMYSHELQTCDWPRNVGCDGVELSSQSSSSTTRTSPNPPSPPSRSREEPRQRYTIPTPPPPSPQAIVTSRGQPRQLVHNQEIIKQRQQQQLYAEADETLPPAEEIESDRQQRVYRGQPSTVGQVQRDRDGLRQNAISSYSGRGDKIGVISFGTGQQYRETIDNELTDLTLRRQRRQIDRSNMWRIGNPSKYTPLNPSLINLQPPPLPPRNLYSNYQNYDSDEFKPFVPQYKINNNGNNRGNKQTYSYYTPTTTLKPDPNYSYFNLGSVSTYRAADTTQAKTRKFNDNDKVRPSIDHNKYENLMQQSRVVSQNLTKPQTTSSTEDYDENFEDNSNEFGPNSNYFAPPPSYYRPINKYENIQNPFADPNFDFDEFLNKLKDNRFVTTERSTTSTTLKTSNFKIITTTRKIPTKEYYYYDEDITTNPRKIYSSQIKPNYTTENPQIEYEYYNDYDYPDNNHETNRKPDRYVNKTDQVKYSAKYQEKSPSIKTTTNIYGNNNNNNNNNNVLSTIKPLYVRQSLKNSNDNRKFISTTTPTITATHIPVFAITSTTPKTTKYNNINNNDRRTETTYRPSRGKTRQRLTTIHTDNDKRQRVETSTSPPISTGTTRTLYNNSQYKNNNNNNNYDPYYTLYDDDVELYRDVDYSQQYNNQPSQSYRRTPTPIIQSTRAQDEPKRGNAAYLQNNYQTQDIYQPSTVPDYNEDNSYNSQVEDQNSYRQINRQPSRGDRNDLNYFEESTKRILTTSTTTTTTRKPTTTTTRTTTTSTTPTTTTTRTTTPRTIPTKKSTVPRLPVTSNENKTQPLSLINIQENPGPISKIQLPIIQTSSTPKQNTITIINKPEYSSSIAAIVNRPSPFTLPKYITTENPLVYHYVTKSSSKSTPLVSSPKLSDNQNRIIIPTTYSPPKFFLKNILPKSTSTSTTVRTTTTTTTTTKPSIQSNKTLKNVRKLISPLSVNYGLLTATETSYESAEKLANDDNINTTPVIITTTTNGTVIIPVIPLTNHYTSPPPPPIQLTTDKKLSDNFGNSEITTFRSDFESKLRHYIEPLINNNKTSKYRNTVEIPPANDLIDVDDNIKQLPDQLPDYKLKPVQKFLTTPKTTTKKPKIDNIQNSQIPQRISRVNTAIKSLIAFGATRRQNIKCNENQTVNIQCNDHVQRTSATRGRGSTHYSNSNNNVVSNEVTVNVNRGTPPPRSRPTLKPSTSIVSKASEFIDIYKYPPSRPEPIYPQPQPDKTAAKCRKDVCLLPDCSCGGKEIPGDLPVEQVPQIVLLTFDDSVNDLNKGLYTDLFEKGRVNPNGCPIAATFYVSHEWTDYSQVQNLYSDGHELASHTVSHSFGEQFSQKKWTREVAGQREILSAYGGVRLEDVRGMRAPFLSVGGNKMFKMLYDSNFTYDSSMPIYENKPPSWPYTLDYKLFHDCMIPPCPTRSYPGVWEVPMVMWQDLNGGRCSMGDACSNPSDAEGVFKMIMKNFQRHYTTNRAPFGLFYHAAWFTQPHHKEGFINFLDTVLEMKDVWFVTNWQAIQWIRDPTPISRLGTFQPFQCEYSYRPKRCNNPKVCNLWHKSGVRYMRTCQPCPDIYPWTGNTGIRSSRIDNDIED